ncbi:hypothetical protein OIO90_004574 [Microbotryomycetes sp. JL221]|nr:hypothetical protein OIO90_004574 [Microbotryomycetes sp. JL221]
MRYTLEQICWIPCTIEEQVEAIHHLSFTTQVDHRIIHQILIDQKLFLLEITLSMFSSQNTTIQQNLFKVSKEMTQQIGLMANRFEMKCGFLIRKRNGLVSNLINGHHEPITIDKDAVMNCEMVLSVDISTEMIQQAAEILRKYEPKTIPSAVYGIFLPLKTLIHNWSPFEVLRGLILSWLVIREVYFFDLLRLPIEINQSWYPFNEFGMSKS